MVVTIAIEDEPIHFLLHRPLTALAEPVFNSTLSYGFRTLRDVEM